MTINPLLSEKEAARILGKSIQSLRNDRAGKRTIPYIKLGRNVRYKPEDLVAFIEGNRIEGKVGER